MSFFQKGKTRLGERVGGARFVILWHKKTTTHKEQQKRGGGRSFMRVRAKHYAGLNLIITQQF